jgi:DNA-binding response OmpR family regulator
MSIRVLYFGNTLKLKDLVKATLVPLNCDIITASSIALAVYLAHKNFPELILCEAGMPDDSGLNLLKEIRADAALAELPFVFLAAKPVDTMHHAEAFAMGASKCISPVYGPEDFLPQIEEYLHERMRIRPPESSE